MSGVGVKLGMMALQKGGDWLVNKISTKVSDGVQKSATDAFFKYLTGVPQGTSGDLVGDVEDYRGRKHFDWGSTRATGGGVWAKIAHRGHFVDGETLNRMLAEQQDNPAFQTDRITLDDFKALLDKLPEDGSEPENKGMVRLIKKDGKLVLDKVGAWGLGGFFVNFRCNMDAEHNRQVRALFVDSVMKDMQAIFPTKDSGAGMTGATLLLAEGGLMQKMDAVYSKLQNLLSTEEKLIPKEAGGNDRNEAKVIAQKLLRKDVADVLNEFNRIFDETGVKNVFNALIDDACGVLGIEDEEGGQTKTEAFLAKYGAQITQTFGKSYDELIAEIVEHKSGKELGATMGKMADMLQKLCRQEVLNQEFEKIRQNEPGLKFDKDTSAYNALQSELKNEAREIIADMGDNAPKDVVDVLTLRFMDEIMPYMLLKCSKEQAYRGNFSIDTVKAALGDYIRNLGSIRRNDGELAAKNHQVIAATLTSEKENAQRKLQELDAKLAQLLAEGKSNDSVEVIDVHRQQIAYQGDVSKLDRSLALVKAIKTGDLSQINGNTRIAKWLKGLGEAQRKQLKEYLDQGFTAANKEVFAKWLEHQWAEKFFGVKLPIREDFHKIQKSVTDTFEEQFMHALAANTAREGEEGLNEFIGKLGDMLMDSSFAKRLDSSKLKKINEQRHEVEARDVGQQQSNSVIEGLIESFVKAAISVKIENDEKLADFVKTAKDRSDMIAKKLKKVCDGLMNEWGDKMLNQFDRSLKSYFNAGLLRLQEVEDQMDGFRRDLSNEIGEKLLKTFTASLADLVTIKDAKAFEKALDGRLKECAGRTQRACQEKANAIVYGLLGFSLDEREIEAKPDEVRFRNADLVGKGYVHIEREFAANADFKGQSETLSSAELKQAFAEAGKHLWMDLVVRNAPGRGNLFGEFVKAFAKAKKENIKASILGLIERKQKTVPQFILDLVNFEKWKVVKETKGLFLEDLAPTDVSDEWVKKLQRTFGLEMAARLDGYQGFERKFLAACDRAIEARLKTLQGGADGELLAGLSADALAALAKDVRARIGQDGIKQVLKESLASAEFDDSDAVIGDLVNRALAGLQDKSIITALGEIKNVKREEIMQLLDQDKNFADKIESSLRAMLPKMYQEGAGSEVLDILSFPNGFLVELSKWMSGRIQLQLTDNALTIYNHLTQEKNEFYDLNTLEAQIGRARNSVLEEFPNMIKGLSAAADGYVKSFGEEDHNIAMVTVKALLGALNNSNPPKLSLDKQRNLEDCLAVYTEKLAKLKECDPLFVKTAKNQLHAAVVSRESTLYAEVGKWFAGHAEDCEELVSAVRKKLAQAEKVGGNDITDVLKQLDTGKKTDENSVGDAISSGKDKIYFAYQSTVGNTFDRFENIHKLVSGYQSGGASRKGMLDLLREKIAENPKLLQEDDSGWSFAGTWDKWFANERLQRALDYVLQTKCADIPSLSDQLSDEHPAGKLADYISGEVLKCLENHDGTLKEGKRAVISAYNGALKQHIEVKIDYGRMEPPTGNLRTALLNLLDCCMPLGGKKEITVESVVADYRSQLQAVADETFMALHGLVQEEYSDALNNSVERFEAMLAEQHAQAELLAMYKDYCGKVYSKLTFWALSSIINGEPLEETAQRMKQYGIYSVNKAVDMFADFEAATNMFVNSATMAMLTNTPKESPEVQALVNDEVTQRLVANVQRRVLKQIILSCEKAVESPVAYDQSHLDKLVGVYCKPIDADPKASRSESDVKSEAYKWIAPESTLWSKIPERKNFLKKEMSAKEPRKLVSESEMLALSENFNEAMKKIHDIYGGFRNKHPLFVDLALGGGRLYSQEYENFMKMCREQNKEIGPNDRCGLSIDDLIARHEEQLRRVKRYGLAPDEMLNRMKANCAALKELWQPFAKRIDIIMGQSGSGDSGAMFAPEGNNYRLQVTDAEFRRFRADVNCVPDDFPEEIAYKDGEPNAKVVEAVKNVAQDLTLQYLWVKKYNEDKKQQRKAQ